MKIGIVTIYDGNNMGSFLQAIALKDVLEGMGHEVVFVERMTEEENLHMFMNRPFSKLRRFPLNSIASVKRFFLNQTDDRKRREEIKKIYDILSIERLSLPKVKISDIEDINLLICGSDEIWNFNNTSISVPFYTCQNYGQNIKKIAYAVSIGTSSVCDFNKRIDIISAISKFHYIFPRDYHSKEVLDETLGMNLDIVCDPTLLVERERLCGKTERLVTEPYIMVYAYDLTEKEQQLLHEFSNEVGLPIISVYHYLKVANRIVTESPYLFAALVANAEYCYTSTFHGTIFCALFAKRFLYYPRRSKVKEVAQYLDIEDRLWMNGDYYHFKAKMIEDINRIKIDRKLEVIKKKNIEKLKQVISDSAAGR